MDQQGFSAMLEARNVPSDVIVRSLSLAEQFEDFVQGDGNAISGERAREFIDILIQENQNDIEDFIALARYAFFLNNNEAYMVFVEILDGAEVPENLYHKVAERYGEEKRDKLYENISLPALGIAPAEKPGYIQPVIERIISEYGEADCRELIADSLRDLPEESYFDLRDDYQNSQNIDEFLALRKCKFVENLENLKSQGLPFFTQDVTDEVIAFVQDHPEIGGGARQGNIVYETKIPYLTQEYLSETDETRKRYFYCHCPWAREAILSGESVTATFCNCSAGYHKRPWEVIFEQPIKAEVIASVLQGDDVCRFAIHIPSIAIPNA